MPVPKTTIETEHFVGFFAKSVNFEIRQFGKVVFLSVASMSDMYRVFRF
jgi:hypothetical protein